MGKPNQPCFKQNITYIKYVHPTTTLTPEVVDQDYFYIPQSGINCPDYRSSSEGTIVYSDPPSIGTFIKVADILIGDDGCGPYQLKLSGTDAIHFKIFGRSLYFDASVDDCPTTIPPTTTTTTTTTPEPYYCVRSTISGYYCVELADGYYCAELSDSYYCAELVDGYYCVEQI